MRLLLVVLLLAAGTADAQTLTRGQMTALTALGTVCGLGAMIVVSPTSATGVGILATAAAVPAGAAACIASAARRRGYDVRFNALLPDAALGAAGGFVLGWGAGALTFHAVNGAAGGAGCCFPPGFIPGVAVGSITFGVASAAWTVRGLPREASVVPAPVAAPDGRFAPGLSLRVAL